jgi:predicted PurR-regulated permease PerM
VLVVIAGIYMASRPESYRDGFLLLFPARIRRRIGEATDGVWNALRHWLVGQVVAMLFVGVLVTLGLAILGVPSALALGFIAGLADFVPMVGPILALAPAVLLGLSVSPATALWVIVLYFVVQQIEGNIVTPLVQRRAVDLPPVITLFALIAFGVLFGPLGVVFATPLAVAVVVAVRQLYIRDTLGEETSVPGERGNGGRDRPAPPRKGARTPPRR